jgi:hypothetical protein
VRAVDPDFEEAAGPLPVPPDGLPAPAHHPGGTFAAAGLDLGFYAVEVHAPGYCFARVRPIALRLGQPTHVIVRLVPGRTLAGAVVDAATGAGVAGARVELRLPPTEPGRAIVALDAVVGPDTPDPDGQLARVTTTDAEGSFRVSDLGPGPLLLLARHERYVPGRSLARLAQDELDARITLAPPASLSGRVDGPGDARTTVHVLAYGGPGNLRTVRVTLGGEYRFEGLAPGGYLVRACLGDPRDFLLSRIRPQTDARGAPRPADVALRAGEAAELPLLAEPPLAGDIAGMVRGPAGAIGGWRVTLLPPEPSDPGAPRFIGRHFATTTRADGSFGLTDVPIGQYGLQFVSMGGRSPNAPTVLPVTISAGTPTHVEVEL